MLINEWGKPCHSKLDLRPTTSNNSVYLIINTWSLLISKCHPQAIRLECISSWKRICLLLRFILKQIVMIKLMTLFLFSIIILFLFLFIFIFCILYLGTVLVCQGCHNKILWTEWLKQQKFIFSQFQRLEAKIKALEGLVSSKASLLGLQMAVFSLCLHMVFPLCVSVFKFPVVIWHSSYWIRAYPNDLILTFASLKAISPNTITFWDTGG